MIRTSKHNISNITNLGKLNYLDQLFIDYKCDLEVYIKLIINGSLPLKTNLSSALLPANVIKHSRYKQLIYKQASEIIRSQTKKASDKRFNRYKKVYTYFKTRGRQTSFLSNKFSELNLKDVINTKYFTVPNLNNISINLDERFFDIILGTSFNSFVKIILPYFNEKGTRALNIKVPLKYHKHSNELVELGFTLRKNIQLKKVGKNYMIALVWFKEDLELKTEGGYIGLDLGYNKLIVSSNHEVIGGDMKQLYQRISKKKQGSKNFKQLLVHRDNEINKYVNQLKLDNTSRLYIEDLLNVKHKSELSNKINNKLQRWSYIKTIDKITRTCEVKGIQLVKVSPAYTSQTCSSCGNIDKLSRKGEEYKCVSCGYEIDADYNASINILNRGVYSLSNKETS